MSNCEEPDCDETLKIDESIQIMACGEDNAGIVMEKRKSTLSEMPFK